MTKFSIRKKLRKACAKAKYTTLSTVALRQANQGRLVTQLTLSVIAATTVVGIGNPAHAYQIYFGRDLNTTGSSGFPRLPSTPQADAARNNFFANLEGVETETFEGFASGSSAPLSVNFSGVGTATFAGTGIIRNLPTGTFGTGEYPISGNQFLGTSNGYYVSIVPPVLLNNPINFSNPVAALGFYATGLDFFPEMSPTSLTFTRTNGSTLSVDIPTSSAIATSVLYFGIVAEDPSEVFTTATFNSRSSRTNSFGLDDLTVASFNQVKPVPEPLTILGSLAAGSFGVALRRKYKQKQQS